MSKKAKILTLIICVLIIVVTALAWLFVSILNKPNEKQNEIIAAINNKPAGYNFDQLKKTYPEVIGWLDVPNTNISLPIVQSPTDDSFYLNHNAKKEFDINGALYTEMANNPNFTDPVSVIYGHNMNDGSMFASIHNFENKDFFNNNDKFYIYIPGHKLTYTIFLAEITDDKHILNSHNFADKQILLKYFSDMKSNISTSKNFRDVELNEHSKIAQLSTCMSDAKLENQRYILSGVLTSDQETQ